MDTSANKEFQQLGKRRFPEQNGSDSLPRLQIPNKISKIEPSQDSQIPSDSKLMIINSNSSLPTNSILPNSNPSMQQQSYNQPRIEQQSNILPTFSSITSSFQNKDTQQQQQPSLSSSGSLLPPSNPNQPPIQSSINPPLQNQSQGLPQAVNPSMGPSPSMSQSMPSSIPQSHQNVNIQSLAPLPSTIPQQQIPSSQQQPIQSNLPPSTSFIEENTPDYRVTFVFCFLFFQWH